MTDRTERRLQQASRHPWQDSRFWRHFGADRACLGRQAKVSQPRKAAFPSDRHAPPALGGASRCILLKFAFVRFRRVGWARLNSVGPSRMDPPERETGCDERIGHRGPRIPKGSDTRARNPARRSDPYGNRLGNFARIRRPCPVRRTLRSFLSIKYEVLPRALVEIERVDVDDQCRRRPALLLRETPRTAQDLGNTLSTQ